ncbi:MAG: hypothetical protein A3F90_06725 [Deltaproteobacteria bacterium RIFCSPLOWO2_12_FULL_60_19]|nr:MAG: hypothetical protein A3F90_06725 [Deltaproteobacteria bacterium RIFCSPLOWO2_12_FULL_60_19]
MGSSERGCVKINFAYPSTLQSGWISERERWPILDKSFFQENWLANTRTKSRIRNICFLVTRVGRTILVM